MTTTRRTFFGTILAALGLAKATPAATPTPPAPRSILGGFTIHVDAAGGPDPTVIQVWKQVGTGPYELVRNLTQSELDKNPGYLDLGPYLPDTLFTLKGVDNEKFPIYSAVSPPSGKPELLYWSKPSDPEMWPR